MIAGERGPIGGPSTEDLIQAVLDNRPTVGPSSMSMRTGARRGLGAIVATTVGKLALCTTVAAASVGGVYATTDRIDLPVVDDREAGEASDVTEPQTQRDGSGPGDETVGETEITTTEGARAVAHLVDGLELNGCEFGQAVAESASAGATDHRQNVGPGIDPCDRTAEGSSEPGPREDRPATVPELPDSASGRPGTPEPAESDQAGSDGRGRPENSGRSADAGRP